MSIPTETAARYAQMDLSLAYLASRIVKGLVVVAIGVLLTVAGDRLGFKGIGWQFVKGAISKGADELISNGGGAARQLPAPSSPITADEIFWFTIRDSAAPGLFEEFVSKFPSSKYVPAAEAKLVRLRKDRPVSDSMSAGTVEKAPVCVVFNEKRFCE